MTKLIAEFCQNHNGDRSVLNEMIHAAKENGATYGKIQSIWSADVTKRERFETGATAPDGTVLTIKRPYQAEVDRLKKLELSLDDHLWFISECQKVGLIPFTTIFAVGHIADVARLPWPQRITKVPSYDCSSVPYLRQLAANFETIFISTGASFDDEIERAARVLRDRKFVFFHCVTKYPNDLEDCNLARLQYLRRFSDEVGWSDHTAVAKDGVKAAKAAMALGADYVERHFTVLPADKTKDGPVSITPALLKELSDFSKLSRADQLREAKKLIPDFNRIVGHSKRDLTAAELLNRDYYRGRFATHVGDKIIYNWNEYAQ